MFDIIDFKKRHPTIFALIIGLLIATIFFIILGYGWLILEYARMILHMPKKIEPRPPREDANFNNNWLVPPLKKDCAEKEKKKDNPERSSTSSESNQPEPCYR